VAVAAIVAGSCGPVVPRDATLPDGFPGWRSAGETRLFRGAELYGHINGGAEVFLELGFDELLVRRYTSERGELQVELYRMTDPTAALGIYLMKSGDERPDVSLAARHTVHPRQLQMVRGDAYMILNVVESDEDLGRDLVAVAGRLAGGMAEVAAGDLFSRLPVDDRVPGSERVVRGPFTLEPLFTLGDGDILSLGGELTAVAAQYRGSSGQPFTRISVTYPDINRAQRAFAHLAGHLDPYLEVVTSEAGRLVFLDYRELYGQVRLTGSEILIEVNLIDPPG
jgi:hypothetical protein